MSIIACSIDECEKPTVARGICRSHYKKAKRRGTLGDYAKVEREVTTSCSIEGCERLLLARGWCGTHYKRWRLTGSTDDPAKYVMPPCGVEGCVNRADKGRGMCGTHYARWRRVGSAGAGDIKQFKKPIVDGKRQCSGCLDWVALAGYNANSHPGTLANKCRACQRLDNVAWREANPTYWQQWQKDNVQKTRDISNRRRAHKLSREHEKIDRDLVFERDGYECKLCMRPLDMGARFPHPLSPTLDHIIPLNKGGHHLYVNLQAAHFRCNTAKGDRIDPSKTLTPLPSGVIHGYR